MDGFTKIFIVLLFLLLIGFVIMVIGIIRLSFSYKRSQPSLPKPNPIPPPLPSPLPEPSPWTEEQINKIQNIFNKFFKIFVPDKSISIDINCFKKFIGTYTGSFEDFLNIFKDVNSNNIPTDDNVKLIISTINSFIILCEPDLQWNNGISDLDLKNLLPSILDDNSKFSCVKDKITKKYTYVEFSFLLHLLAISMTKLTKEDDLPATFKDFVNYLQNICN